MPLYRKSNIGNIIWISLPEYISNGTLFLINILIAQHFGASILGEYAFNYTISQIVTQVFGAGILIVMKRDFITDQKFHHLSFTSFLAIRLLLMVALLIIMGCLNVFNVITFSLLLLFAAKLLDVLIETYHISMQSFNNFKSYSIWKTLQSTLLILFILLAVFYFRNIKYLYIMILLNSTIFFIFISIYAFGKYDYKPNIRFDNEVRSTLKKSLPLILSSLIYILGSRIIILILKYNCSKEELGYYSAITSTIIIFTLFSNAIGVFLFNRLIIEFKKGFEYLGNMLKKHTIKLFFLSLIMTILCIISSKYILLVYKIYSYENDILTKIIALSLPAIFTQAAIAYIFTILNKNKYSVYFSTYQLVINFVISFILIYFFQYKGAIYSFLINSYISCISLVIVTIYMLTRKHLSVA